MLCMSLHDIEVSQNTQPFVPALARQISPLLQLDKRGLLCLPGRGYLCMGWYHPTPGGMYLGHADPDIVPEQLLELMLTAVSDIDWVPDSAAWGVLTMLTPPAMRPIYMYLHEVLRRRAENGDFEPWYGLALQAERTIWGRAEQAWVKRHLTPHIRKERIQHIEHWLWQRPVAAGKRADVTWHGHWNVPVHRLLWPQFRSTELLYPDRRLVKAAVCPDPEFKNCVNPHHYEYAVTYTDRLALKPGHQFTQRLSTAPFQHKWTMENVWSHSDGPLLVHCPKQHVMPPGVQDSLLLQMNPRSSKYQASPHGRSICAECRYDAGLQRGVNADGSIKRRPRGLKQPNQELIEQATRDFEYGFVNRAMDHGKYEGTSELFNDLVFDEPDN